MKIETYVLRPQWDGDLGAWVTEAWDLPKDAEYIQIDRFGEVSAEEATITLHVLHK